MEPLALIHKTPLIWGHRGARSLAAENTLRAMRKGHEAGAHGWEIDVQPTRDGELIVFHDLNLLRTTNAGVHPAFRDKAPLLPWRFSIQELKTLSADVFPRRFCLTHPDECSWQQVPRDVPDDVRIPTLSETLQLAAELGMWINIEIKDLSHTLHSELETTLVERVHARVAAEKMEGQVILSSFNHQYMAKSKKHNSAILTGLLTPHTFQGNPVELVKSHNADAWHPGYKGLTEDAVRAARSAGIAINPYTVNDPEIMKQLTAWGVTGLVTDCPQDVPNLK